MPTAPTAGGAVQVSAMVVSSSAQQRTAGAESPSAAHRGSHMQGSVGQSSGQSSLPQALEPMFVMCPPSHSSCVQSHSASCWQPLPRVTSSASSAMVQRRAPAPRQMEVAWAQPETSVLATVRVCPSSTPTVDPPLQKTKNKTEQQF
jgi:hypothetical protein